MIFLDNVSLTSGGREIIKKIKLTIEDGEWVSLTGRNGSGKSTLLSLAARLREPDSGSVRITGGGNGSVPVAIAMQNPDSQFVTASVGREISFGMDNVGLGGEEAGRRFDRAVRLFDLGRLIERNPHTLSGGEKQRVLLASIWVLDPRHLILDEPFSFLDRPSAAVFMRSVRELFHKRGKTVVWATLRGSEIGASDRVVCLRNGEVAFSGAPSAFLKDPPEGLLAEEPRGNGRPSGAEGGLETASAGHGRNAGSVFEPAAGSAFLTASLKTAIETISESKERLKFGGGCERPPEVMMEDAFFSYEDGCFSLGIEEFELREAESVGLTGASGSGKTTMLSACAGLRPPDSGLVRVLGKEIRSRRDFQPGRVALLFQTPEEGFFAPTVAEEVGLSYRAFRGKRGLEEGVREALEAVGLDYGLFASKNPFSLSQGEKRLVAIASTLILPADLFIFDEPSLFLDGGARRLVSECVQNHAEKESAVLIATHDLDFLSPLANRFLKLC